MMVEWSTFKSFVDDRKLSVQWVEIESRYMLKAFDGNFYLECHLNKTLPDQSEIQDFENNYKAAGNRPPKSSVVQVLGKDDLTLDPRAMFFTATKHESTIHDKLLD